MVAMTMLLADASQPAWWVVAGGAVVAACTTLNRLLDTFEFRRRMNEEIGRLKQRDDEQERLIDKQRKRIDALSTELAEKNVELFAQRRVKDTCLSNLQAAMFVVSLYRRQHGQHDDDNLDLDAIARWARTSQLTVLTVADASAAAVTKENPCATVPPPGSSSPS